MYVCIYLRMTSCNQFKYEVYVDMCICMYVCMYLDVIRCSLSIHSAEKETIVTEKRVGCLEQFLKKNHFQN